MARDLVCLKKDVQMRVGLATDQAGTDSVATARGGIGRFGVSHNGSCCARWFAARCEYKWKVSITSMGLPVRTY